jgi:hypothetical protein
MKIKKVNKLKTGKIDFSITLSIKSDGNGAFDYDTKMESLAKKYRGFIGGSGYGFGARDYSAHFKTEKSAINFLKHIKKLKKVNNIACWLNYDNALCYEQMAIDLI